MMNPPDFKLVVAHEFLCLWKRLPFEGIAATTFQLPCVDASIGVPTQVRMNSGNDPALRTPLKCCITCQFQT